MKERPILFSTNSVKAILDARKSMTRRVIKPQPYENTTIIKPPDEWREYWQFERVEDDQSAHCVKCPYGQVGDLLWVRETCFIGGIKPNEWVSYKADTVTKDIERYVWKPSIFMPRWASRITLEITEVRVERLQGITSIDCREEGLCYPPQGDTTHYIRAYINGFKTLWDSPNAKRGYGWETNPWVWVISFKVVK